MTTTYSPCPQCSQVNRVNHGNNAAKQPVCGHCNSPLKLDGAVSEVTGPGLERLLKKSPLPVVVDFWAPWCGPCRMFAPTFKSVASRFSDRMVFAKLNTEGHEATAAKYRIQSIPTLIAFHGEEELIRLPGALPEPKFEHWLNLILNELKKSA